MTFRYIFFFYFSEKIRQHCMADDTHEILSLISLKKNQNVIYNNLDYNLTLVLPNLDISCLCKQCRARSVGFWRSQLIWICTVWHSVCEFIATTWIKPSDWLKIRSGHGILIYSTWQGLRVKGIYGKSFIWYIWNVLKFYLIRNLFSLLIL